MTPLEGKLQILLNAVREADPGFAEELEARKASQGQDDRSDSDRT